jgi:N-acetylmuramoyl-L-alanine amidase
MFVINSHVLGGMDPQGNAVRQEQSGNHNGAITPKVLVFHYTACDATAARNAFMRNAGANRVSAHLLVDTDGAVTQFVRLNLRAWHAGPSQWAGYHDMNTHSIGVEVVNYGYLLKSADGAFHTAEAKKVIAPADVIEARHAFPHWPWLFWHAYTDKQIETCKVLAEVLVSTYALQDVVGHEDIAPKRKVDPGPAFPLARLRGNALGRNSQPADGSLYVAVNKLNIRVGAGVAFAKSGPPLLRNTQLRVIGDNANGWLNVETLQAPPVTGWVLADYTAVTLT